MSWKAKSSSVALSCPTFLCFRILQFTGKYFSGFTVTTMANSRGEMIYSYNNTQRSTKIIKIEEGVNVDVLTNLKLISYVLLMPSSWDPVTLRIHWSYWLYWRYCCLKGKASLSPKSLRLSSPNLDLKLLSRNWLTWNWFGSCRQRHHVSLKDARTQY